MSIDLFAKINRDVSEVPIEQIGSFVSLADAASLQATFTEEVSSSLGSLGDGIKLPSINFGKLSSIKLDTMSLKDGTSLIKEGAASAKNLLESAKDAMFSASGNLRNSFSALPRSLQSSIVGESGILNSNAFKLPAMALANSYSNFYNRVVSGGYVLNPNSIKLDIKNLASFTSSAMKNGIFNAATNMVGMMAGKPGTFTNILTKVAIGAAINKNHKALLNMGVGMYSMGSVAMPMSAGKNLMIRKVFSDLSLPRVKSSEMISYFDMSVKTINVFDRTGLTTKSGKPSSSAFSLISPDAKRMITASVTDRAPGVSLTDLNTLDTGLKAPTSLSSVSALGLKKHYKESGLYS